LNPACSIAGQGAKGYTSGTHLLVSPRDTLERVQPFLAQTGITRLANVTVLDTIGIAIVLALDRPAAQNEGRAILRDNATLSTHS
jgi:ribosomal protein S12 methylthiotransferase accessory factor YcaO